MDNIKNTFIVGIGSGAIAGLILLGAQSVTTNFPWMVVITVLFTIVTVIFVNWYIKNL